MLDAHFDILLGSFHLDMGFSSESGTTAVILGESGCGKSTVLRLLAGLLHPDKGHFVLDDEIYVDTQQHIDVPPQERPVGFVFQDYVLFPHLCVFDNVAFGLRMQGTPKKEIRKRVGEALEQVHLVGYDDRRPAQLSGGQQQRVAIARALAMKPHLLLLDESLSALDIQTRREVEQELRQILSSLQLTTVMVSHQYIDALLFGHQIIVLDQGKVIQQGKHLDLLLHPHSSFIAEMVGVNLLKGRVVSTDGSGVHTITLSTSNGAGLEVIAVAQDETTLESGQAVSVVVDPRSITLHQSRPESSARNVFRGEIMQNVPVSAAFSETASVKVLHAGSLTSLVRRSIGPALLHESGITLESESGHSVALALAIKDRSTSGDVFLSADAQVNQSLLGATNDDWIRWFVTFARNTVVLAYSPNSRFLSDFDQARRGKIPWYEVLLQPGVQLARNDPNLDPMGYYTLLVCALAEKHYGIPDFKQRLLDSDTNPAQVNRMNIAQLEHGDIDALFLYVSAAHDLALPYLLLPDEINLSNPALAPSYKRVQFTTNQGQTFHGKPISFSAAVLKDTRNPQAALHFMEFLLSPRGQNLVRDAYFIPGPMLVGGEKTSVPSQLQPLLQGDYEN